MISREEISRLIEGETLSKEIEDITAHPAFVAIREKYKVSSPGSLELEWSLVGERRPYGRIAFGKRSSGTFLSLNINFYLEKRIAPTDISGEDGEGCLIEGYLELYYQKRKPIKYDSLDRDAAETLKYELFLHSDQFPDDIKQFASAIASAILAQKEKQ